MIQSNEYDDDDDGEELGGEDDDSKEGKHILASGAKEKERRRRDSWQSEIRWRVNLVSAADGKYRVSCPYIYFNYKSLLLELMPMLIRTSGMFSLGRKLQEFVEFVEHAVD